MANVYNTQNSPVIKEYYYIVNFQDLFNPKLMPIYFLNRRAAEQAIEKNIGSKEQKFYSVLKGNKIIKQIIPFILNQGKMGKAFKYNYPEHLGPMQPRKSYRTLMRRRLRRMGIYTHIMPKRTFWEQPKVIKLIKNTQKVANSPNTIAQAFQLQRKPEHLYYRIIKKKLSKRKGKLFRVKAIRYDSKKGTIKKVTIYILRNDVIIPYLLTELDKIAEKNGHTDFMGWEIRKLKELITGEQK